MKNSFVTWYQDLEGDKLPEAVIFCTTESCNPYYFKCLRRFFEEQKHDWLYQIIRMTYDPMNGTVILTNKIIRNEKDFKEKQ